MVTGSVLPPFSSSAFAPDASPERGSRAGMSRRGHDESPREHIVRDVVRGLYEGRYEPGQRLLEAQITADYGVSRGPVREALNRLAAMGVVKLTPQRGAQVRRLIIHEAIDILVLAQGLVGIGARLAAERIEKPGAAERLQIAFANLSQFDNASGTAAYAMARDGFYAAINAIANNAELSRILPSVQIHLIRVQFRAVMRTVDRRRHRDYQDIMKAILSHNAKAAEKAARAHIARYINALEAYQSANRNGSDFDSL
jgi:DNA-binding GntR family transcriptional regulator